MASSRPPVTRKSIVPRRLPAPRPRAIFSVARPRLGAAAGVAGVVVAGSAATAATAGAAPSTTVVAPE